MKPKISIIIPVYKVEKYIHKCIASILAQTFTDFELILVDDGSPDKCGKICDEYLQIDNRVRVIHKENGGLSSARNAGIDIAQGEYIGFVDSDDYIHPKMYEILYAYAANNSSDITMCDFINIYEETTNDNIDYSKSIQVKNFTNVEALNQLYEQSNIFFIVAWNKLYKKNLFYKLKYEEGKIHEDEFIIHKLLFKSKRITYIPIPLYFYLQRNNSITRSHFNIKMLDAVYAFKDRIDFFKAINQGKLQKKAETTYISVFLSLYIKAKRELKRSQDIDLLLKQLKKDFDNRLFELLKNPYCSWKEKVLWVLFCINPIFYLLYQKLKGIIS